MRTVRYALVVASALAASERLRAEPLKLANARVAAEFGDRGLVALADRDAGVYAFRRDDFSVVVDGSPYESRLLPSPTRATAGDVVTYAWRAGSFGLNVVYELRRDWRVISKGIEIRSE